ncbi:MAG TPA: ABC transporter permease, partial [Gemmatimonadaceae bacterium]
MRRLYLKSAVPGPFAGPGVIPFLSYPQLAAIRARTGGSVPLAGYTPSSARRVTTLMTSDSARISYVSDEFFPALGLRPLIGRFFSADEQRIDTPTPLAVISEGLWRRAFASRSDAIGQTVSFNTTRFTVIGVAPRGFAGLDLDRADIWIPLNCLPGENGQPCNVSSWDTFLLGFARIENPAMEAKLASAGSAGLRSVGSFNRDPDTTLTLLTGSIIEARGPTKNVPEAQVSARVAGIAFIVLIIACANVANMLLLRASNRRREIAVRRALGGSRARLYSQILTESTLLGLLGGATALAFAVWGGTALRTLMMPTVQWSSAAVDARIIAITAAAAFLVGFLAGLAPAVFTTGVDLTTGLKSGASDRRSSKLRTQSALLVVQAALSVVLLVAAGLFLRSLDNVSSIDLGYDREGMVTASVFSRSEEAGRIVTAELPKVAERLGARQGVVAVGLSRMAPMTGAGLTKLYTPGRDSAIRIGGQFPTTLRVGPGFFAASGIRVIAGRDFSSEDRLDTERVIVVDELTANGIWPGENAIGKCLNIVKANTECLRVIGVVEAVHRTRIIEKTGPQYYLPLGQSAAASPGSIVVRVERQYVAAVIAALRTELAPIVQDQENVVVRSMNELLAGELRPWRIAAILVSALGALALIVSAIGIYGIVAFTMSRRTHEMGVRVALGAQRRDILGLVLATNCRAVLVGIAAGIIAALLLGRFVTSLLFGVVPNDPSVLIAAGVTMCAVAGIASVV